MLLFDGIAGHCTRAKCTLEELSSDLLSCLSNFELDERFLCMLLLTIISERRQPDLLCMHLLGSIDASELSRFRWGLLPT